MNPKNKFSKYLVALAAGLLAMTPVAAQSAGRCASAQIPWQMEMPDGSIHEPGQVKLCYLRDYNPVSGLHALQVNGMTLGVLQSTVTYSEEQAALHPILVFRSDGRGHVRLVAYAWPREHMMKVYWLHRPRNGRGDGLTVETLPLRELQRTEEFYIVAAARSS